MRKQQRQGIVPHSLYKAPLLLPRKKWAEMNQADRIAWIEEKRAWLVGKRQREQEYLDRRNADLKTDRLYRADASHELDILAMLSGVELRKLLPGTDCN